MATSPRGNLLILALSQPPMLSAIVLATALAAILGATLAPDWALATLPVAAMVIGTAIASLPASILMRRFGRRHGFLIGALLGISGSLLYRQKGRGGGSGAYRGARWHTAREIRDFFAGLPVRGLVPR